MKFKLCEDVKGKFESEEAFWAALKAGFEVEKEHAASMDNCPIRVVRIAADHLSEDISYYTKLKKMESGDKPQEDVNTDTKDNEKDEKEKEDKDDKNESENDDKDETEKEEKDSSMKV